MGMRDLQRRRDHKSGDLILNFPRGKIGKSKDGRREMERGFGSLVLGIDDVWSRGGDGGMGAWEEEGGEGREGGGGDMYPYRVFFFCFKSNSIFFFGFLDPLLYFYVRDSRSKMAGPSSPIPSTCFLFYAYVLKRGGRGGGKRNVPSVWFRESIKK